MPRRRRKELLVASVGTLGKKKAAYLTSMPHRPVRWCYGLPLTDDPRNFYPDPFAATMGQIATWKRACNAIEHGNEYRRPVSSLGNSVGYEPWGLGITIFPEASRFKKGL